MERWVRGNEIVMREVWLGRVWTAMPAVVVEDGTDQRVFFIPAGTRVKYAVDKEGRELRLYRDEWTLADHVTKRHILGFSWPGSGHAVLAIWDPGWRFTGWYINLEASLGRRGRFYDFVDHCLDVLIPPDRTRWTWKDEEELEEAVRLGIYTKQQASAFRHEGERAARRVLAGEPPFDQDWSGWRPDPAWQVPALRDGWDRVEPSVRDHRVGP
jgi:predicted RNA-binding protein associated with RNAse of E/G family